VYLNMECDEVARLIWLITRTVAGSCGRVNDSTTGITDLFHFAENLNIDIFRGTPIYLLL
jgi:hypothetical protein